MDLNATENIFTGIIIHAKVLSVKFMSAIIMSDKVYISIKQYLSISLFDQSPGHSQAKFRFLFL